MKKLITLLCLAVLIIACKNLFSGKNDAIPLNAVHEITAKESINTSEYTYVRASESGEDIWLVVPKTGIKIRGIYYYQGGMLMENFKSKELNKTFPSVLFLEGLSDNKDKLLLKSVSQAINQNSEEKHVNVNTSNLSKLNLNIKTDKGGATISELFAKKEMYSGKIVKITGLVTKFSPDIMKKNWAHLQDGTENAGKFDLTVTTSALIKQGDTVTFEGKIAINKDFGYGYNYEVLMEDAVIAK
jgi:hypothetical protein